MEQEGSVGIYAFGQNAKNTMLGIKKSITATGKPQQGNLLLGFYHNTTHLNNIYPNVFSLLLLIIDGEDTKAIAAANSLAQSAKANPYIACICCITPCKDDEPNLVSDAFITGSCTHISEFITRVLTALNSDCIFRLRLDAFQVLQGKIHFGRLTSMDCLNTITKAQDLNAVIALIASPHSISLCNAMTQIEMIEELIDNKDIISILSTEEYMTWHTKPITHFIASAGEAVKIFV